MIKNLSKFFEQQYIERERITNRWCKSNGNINKWKNLNII